MQLFKSLICTAMCLSLPVLATDFSAVEKIINDTKTAAKFPSGTSIAIVKGDKVIYQGNFGYADIAKKQPVTSDTSFYIASVTKPYFALSMLLKEHKGQISESTTMATLFPEISFPKFDASKVTVKHLLGHTMGIDNNPLVMATAYTGLHDVDTRKKLVAASYPNEKSPLDTFDYSNVGYNILSVWSDRADKKPWQSMLQDTILKPLKTNRSSTVISDAKINHWQLAIPYSVFNSVDNPPYLRKQDNTMHSAGGMISSSLDMANFLKVQLSNGKLDGKQVFPKSVIEKSQQPIAKVGSNYRDFQRDDYAWGWHIGPYLNEKLYHHFGGYSGMHSHLSFMPEQDIGVVILNNDDMLASKLTNIVAKAVYATLLNKPDEIAKAQVAALELQKLMQKFPARMKQHAEKMAARKWQLTLPESAYLGVFYNEYLGELVVSKTNDKQFFVSLGQLHATATPYKTSDAMRVELIPNRGEPVRFNIKDGKVPSLTYDDATFKRIK